MLRVPVAVLEPQWPYDLLCHADDGAHTVGYMLGCCGRHCMCALCLVQLRTMGFSIHASPPMAVFPGVQHAAQHALVVVPHPHAIGRVIVAADQ